MEKTPLERKQAIYQPLDDRFLIKNEKYKGQQYSQIYFTRLHSMRSLMYSLIPKWKPHVPEGKECIIVGTIYKHMKLKPTILDEYSKVRSVVPLVKPHNFVHPDDHLVLEDESRRVKLSGSVISQSEFVAGIVMAICGNETSDGALLVHDVLVPDLPPQVQLPIASGMPGDGLGTYFDDFRAMNNIKIWRFCHSRIWEKRWKLDATGPVKSSSFSAPDRSRWCLRQAGRKTFNPLQFQLLIDHITGHLGDDKDQSMVSKIVRVVIVGDSVEVTKGLLTTPGVAPKEQSRIFEPIKELDIALTQLAASIYLDIMPGKNDPANFSLPQQPLNRCLFPGASLYNTFTSCTHPHMFDIDGVCFVGTSGQNIDDLDKYSYAKDRLEFLERTLRWRHLAPTTPNTLGCYPYTNRDPFLVEECPHVYFCGNQDKYETKVVDGSEGQRVRLIWVPRFCESGTAVVLNTRNLECHTLRLSTDFDL